MLENQVVSQFGNVYTSLVMFDAALANFSVTGEYKLSSMNKLTLKFSATEKASFRCRVIKHSPPPLFTMPWNTCE